MPPPAAIEQARELLRSAKSVAVLTGAGISAESGVPTFRGADGYWQGLSVQDLASPEGFARNPRRVWEWYNLRRNTLRTIQPNAGHRALAELERRVAEFGLATQNVDRLHQAAGSRRLAELHGNIFEVRCTNEACARALDRTGVELPAEPRCESCGGWLRPGVVWFGEMMPVGAMVQAEQWAAACEVFLVIGTSAIVWPAAGLAHTAKRAGAEVIEINIEETPITELAELTLLGKAGEILPRIV